MFGCVSRTSELKLYQLSYQVRRLERGSNPRLSIKRGVYARSVRTQPMGHAGIGPASSATNAAVSPREALKIPHRSVSRWNAFPGRPVRYPCRPALAGPVTAACCPIEIWSWLGQAPSSSQACPHAGTQFIGAPHCSCFTRRVRLSAISDVLQDRLNIKGVRGVRDIQEQLGDSTSLGRDSNSHEAALEAAAFQSATKAKRLQLSCAGTRMFNYQSPLTSCAVSALRGSFYTGVSGCFEGSSSCSSRPLQATPAGPALGYALPAYALA